MITKQVPARRSARSHGPPSLTAQPVAFAALKQRYHVRGTVFEKTGRPWVDPDSPPYLYIDLICAAEKGYGRKIFEQIIKLARDHSLPYIALRSVDGATGAYTKWGFEKLHDQVREDDKTL